MCDSMVPRGAADRVQRFDLAAHALSGEELRNIPSDPGSARCTTPARSTETDSSSVQTCVDWSLRWPTDTPVFHGEFDPGSGRTLAACLTHASGATNLASARGRAANG